MQVSRSMLSDWLTGQKNSLVDVLNPRQFRIAGEES